MKLSNIKRTVLQAAEMVFILVLVMSMYGIFLDILQNLFPRGTPISKIVNEKMLFSGLFSSDEKNIRLDIDGQELSFAGNSDIDAIISSKFRTVKTKRANAITWTTARNGMGLKSQDAVQTFNRSSADIKLSNAGSIKLGENSLIIIRNNDEDILLQEKRTRILMVAGELQGSVNEIANDNAQIKIATASGATAILSNLESKKTVFKIKVNKDKSSVITVLEGTARIEAQDKVVRINKNQQLKIKKDEAPGLPEYLADAVYPVSPDNMSSFYYRDLPPEIHFKWNLQNNVDEYEFVLARDKAFKDIVTEQQVSRSFFKHGNLRHGKYFWRVRSLDRDKDALFSETREIRVVRDTKPPVMKVNLPQGNKITSNTFELTGTTEPDASVFVNSKPVAVKENGSFKYKLKLKKGTNVVIVEAVDTAGNTTYKSEMLTVPGQE